MRRRWNLGGGFLEGFVAGFCFAFTPRGLLISWSVANGLLAAGVA